MRVQRPVRVLSGPCQAPPSCRLPPSEFTRPLSLSLARPNGLAGPVMWSTHPCSPPLPQPNLAKTQFFPPKLSRSRAQAGLAPPPIAQLGPACRRAILATSPCITGDGPRREVVKPETHVSARYWSLGSDGTVHGSLDEWPRVRPGSEDSTGGQHTPATRQPGRERAAPTLPTTPSRDTTAWRRATASHRADRIHAARRHSTPCANPTVKHVGSLLGPAPSADGRPNQRAPPVR